MQPEERDAAYLWDRLEAAREVIAFTAGIAYHAYIDLLMLTLRISGVSDPPRYIEHRVRSSV